jgi:hypothetical protein
MYQENVLNAFKAEDAVGVNKSTDFDSFFAPANDPFVTATVLSEVVAKRNRGLLPIEWVIFRNLSVIPVFNGDAMADR